MEWERNRMVVASRCSSINVPVVMTPWAWRLAFETLDPDLAWQFVRTYRNRVPEPQALYVLFRNKKGFEF